MESGKEKKFMFWALLGASLLLSSALLTSSASLEGNKVAEMRDEKMAEKINEQELDLKINTLVNLGMLQYNLSDIDAILDSMAPVNDGDYWDWRSYYPDMIVNSVDALNQVNVSQEADIFSQRPLIVFKLFKFILNRAMVKVIVEKFRELYPTADDFYSRAIDEEILSKGGICGKIMNGI